MNITIDNNELVRLSEDPNYNADMIDHLTRNKARLIIPTPVLAEFYAFDYLRRKKAFLTVKSNIMQVYPLDEKSATICGDITSKYYNELKQSDDRDQQRVKVDLQILAIALATNSEFILTRDSGIEKMIRGLNLSIKVLSLGNLTGMPLFDQPSLQNKI